MKIYLSATTVPGTTRPFVGSLSEQETSVAASYAWATFSISYAYGGSYQADYLANASVGFGFTGSSLTWYTILGPNRGVAAVSIDGVSRPNVNAYSPTWIYHRAITYSGLSSGYHRVSIRVLGQRGSAAATGTWVSLDAFAVSGTFIQPALHFAWQSVSSLRASGGHLVHDGAKGAVASFTFRGRTIDWITVVGPSEGSATVYVDGVKQLSVSNRAATAQYGVVRRVSNLTDAVHTLRIVASGMISVDRFDVRLPNLSVFSGLGTWVDLYDYTALDPSTAAAAMRARGVRTLYIETARYNSTSAFDFPTLIGEWVEAAHANGMKIVGWYLPIYGTYLNTDVARTVAVATYRSPNGQAFDGVGIDIESKTSTETRTDWFRDIATHLARVRAGVTAVFPVGAIVIPPWVMDKYPTSWSGFPWSSVGAYANVVLPMSYWSFRTQCATDPSQCPYQYTVKNVNESRSYTGGLPVHVIGGVADSVTAQGVSDFMKGAKDAKAYGASLYDYRTTTNSTYWSIMAGANSL